ncbi:EAL domain-containing protein [Sphaerotilus sp.]|uniref:EAL domain-containing protein n=1 Tax=Sphaerotilus sp. TaxID=2093942 RepID=UPI00286E1F86|nr:EAL domain-containing protein [Sphaerotilus sp.]
MPAPKPLDEAARLRTLHGLNVLDSPADPVLDGLVRSAALALDCPISMVSLVDAGRQWFKAVLGLPVTQTDRATGLCGYTILGDTVFEVPDTTLDERFADNPLVTGEPNLRFYAGVPIDIDGHKIGTLCILDREPRRLTEAQRGILVDLGRAAAHWMVSWRQAQALDLHLHHLEDRVARRTAELALAKQAAEAANEAKSAFLATMSHEIRTPMNGVVGIVDVLRQSSLTPYQSDLADTIRDSAFALLGILDGILDFSKIEAGHLALESEPVALLRLAEGVCDTLQPVAAARRVALQVFVDPTLPDWISSDAVRLRQILNNLVGNAIKFSAGIERPGQVRVRVEAHGVDRFRLQVCDNGVGLPLSAQTRIFDPFEQAEGSTSRRYGGTGLGLSICRRLASAFGGEIGVESQPGEGAVFTVTLPMHRCDTVPGQLLAAAERVNDLSGLHCHIVLGDAQQARDWCAYLAGAGAQVQCWPALDPLRQALTGLPPDRSTVVLCQTDQTREPLDTTLDRLREEVGAPGLRWVWLAPGQRRNPRVLGPGLVVLDHDALHRAALLKAVALAASRLVPEPMDLAASVPLGSALAPDQGETGLQGRLVLVAEDNDINQKVIRRQLSLLGLAAEVAGNGLDALERARSGRYALLLTDLHMPGMDGYELASAVRREELPGQRLPIIALTANALSGEAERCRAAGMDDYLSKPVQLDQLGATLARWLTGLPEVAAAGPLPAEIPLLPVFDSTALAQLIGDDPVLLASFRRDFLASTRATAQVLRTAVARTDWSQVGALGHRLVSSARAIGAMALGGCCAGLEQAGAAGDGVAVMALLQRFESELALLVARLDDEPAVRDTPLLCGAEPELMLVDDDPFQLQVLQRQLATLGVPLVQSCTSGAAALQRLRGRDTSAMLLLLDLNMPGMDGVEFMRHLAEQHYAGALALISGADTRVLETAAKLASAYQLHVLSHLHKPVPSAILSDLVARWRGFVPAQIHRAARTRRPEEIERALRGNELVLHYQPKVALSDGSVVGVEALVRWRHPTEGLLYPDSFIAVTESSGQIDALTRNVLSQALAQARRWRAAGMALRVAVNVSMDNLARLDFPEFVLREATHHGVPLADLMLEVTESRLTRDARVPMDILTRLRLKHIGLSIDDFGTGHSSLAQLRDIPFDELKIDRGFVHGNRDHATQRAIFTASLEMAHQLDMTAVAEGVEDRADWDFVRAAGCDIAQGFFIGRPMPAEALPEWIRLWYKRCETL